MEKRIFFGSMMIAALAALLIWDHNLGQPGRYSLAGLPVTLLFAALGTVAFIEVARLIRAIGVAVLGVSGLVGAIALGTLPYWWRAVVPGTGASPDGMGLLVVLGLIIICIFAEQMVRARTEDALRRIACTVLAAMYIGVGGALILSLRMDYGVPMLVLFLAAVKLTDVGAYFGGSAIGKHKMILWLSPGKTWEGLACGLATAAMASMICVLAMRIDALTVPKAALFGVVAGGAGQFGDLCESLLKRSAQAKDSGSLIPGFGGVLDVLDSPLLAAPVAWLFLRAMGSLYSPVFSAGTF